MAFSYRQVLEQYDRARAFGGETRSLGEYAAELNDAYQTQDYSEAFRDGPWTRFSTREDMNVFEPIAEKTTVPLVGGVGALFGQREAGEAVGRSLPRIFADMALLAVPFVGPVLTGAAFAGKTYADTGSVPAALVSGGVAAVMPGAGRVAGGLAARTFGVGERVAGQTTAEGIAAKLPEYLRGVFPIAGKETQYKAANFLGQQMSNVGLIFGQMGLTHNILTPDEPLDLLSPEFLIQQIPWTVMDMLHLRKPVGMTSARAREFIVEPKTKAPPTTPKFERQVSPTVEEQATAEAALDNYAKIASDPSIPMEERNAKLAAAFKAVTVPEAIAELKKQVEAGLPEVTAAPTVVAPEPVTVMGHAEKMANGNYRVRVTAYSGEKAVPEHMTVFVNGAEPTIDPATGQAVFKVGEDQISTAVKYGKPEPLVPTPTRVRSEDEAFAPEPPAPVDPQLELQPRPEGVPPTAIPEKPVVTEAEKAALESVGVKPEVKATDPADDINAWRPALVLGGETVVGKPGETHKQILDRYMAEHPDDADALFAFDSKENPNFFATEDGSMTLSRDEFEKKFGVRDSQGLRDKQAEIVQADHIVRLKELAQKIEAEQVKLDTLKASTAKAPESAQEIAANVDTAKAPEVIKAARASGANDTQAATQAVLTTTSPQVEKALTKLERMKAEAKVLTEGKRSEKEAAEKRAKLEKELVKEQAKLAKAAEELDAAEIAYVEYVKNEAEKKGWTVAKWHVENPGIPLFLTKAREKASAANSKVASIQAKLGGEQYVPEQIDVSTGKLGKEQNVYAEGSGERKLFKTENEAKLEVSRLVAEHPEDADRWVVYNAGKNKGEARGYYIREKVNRVVSLDAARTESGQTLQDKVAASEHNANVQEEIAQGGSREGVSAELIRDVSNLPTVSHEGIMDMLDAATESPLDFADYMGLEGSAEAQRMEALQHLGQAKVFFELALKGEGGQNSLEQVNALLPEPAKFKTARDMQARMLKVLNAVRDMEKLRMSYLLDSKTPHDEALVRQTGVRESGIKLVDWLSQQMDLGGITRELVSIYKNFPNELAKLDIWLHDTSDKWLPGTFYRRDAAALNPGFLPNADTRVEWANNMAHEVTHHMERELSTRNDPAAVQYKKDRVEILNTLRLSKELPAKVRAVLNESINDNHYMKAAMSDDFNLFTHWSEKLDKKTFDQWHRIMYALVHQNELVPQMMSDKSVQSFMLATKAPPKYGVKSVLDWFSNVFNKLIGGGPGTDNALAQMLAAYDNYLTGGIMKNTYNGRDYIRDMLIKKSGVKPEALASRLHTVERTFTKGDLYNSIVGFVREGEAGLLPVTTELNEFVPKKQPSAALKYEDGTIVTGVSHADAFNNAEAKGLGDAKVLESGFVTNKGRFVDDKEAAKLNGLQKSRMDSEADLPTSLQVQLDQPLRTALVNPNKSTGDVFDSVMALLPEQLPVHEELFYRMRQDVEIAKNLFREIKAGKITADIPDGAEANLKLADAKLNRMQRALKKQGLAMDRQNQLKNFTYEGFDDTLAAQLTGEPLPLPASEPPAMDLAQSLLGLRQYLPSLSDVKRDTSGAALEGKPTVGWFERNLMFTTYLKKLHPETRPVFSHTMDESGRALQTATELNLVLNGRRDPATGKVHIDQNVRKTLEKVASTKQLSEAFSDVVRLIAERHKAGGPAWSWNDPEFVSALKHLTASGRDMVKTVQAQFKMRHEYFVERVLPQKFGELNRENTARVIATLENGILPDQARDFSEQLYQAMESLSDPQQAMVGQQMLQQLSQQLSPQTFVTAMKHANNSLIDMNRFIDVARKNLDFVSEQRFDAHHLRMTGPNGEKHYSSAKTTQELLARRNYLESQGYKFNYYTPKSDASAPPGGISSEIMSKFQEMDTLAVQRLTDALSGRPDSAALLEKVLPEVRRADEYAASSQAFTPVPGVTRNLVGGREYIDMMENAHEFYVRGINWFRHKKVKATTDLDMLHPEIAGNAQIKDMLDTHVKSYLTPDNQIVRKINEAVFYQRMAFNFGNSLLESFQSLGTGMQALIAETGSIRDAYALTGDAVAAITKHTTTGKWESPELEWFERWSSSVGLNKITMWDDIQDPDRAAVMSVNHRLGTPLQKAGGVLKVGARKWSSFFQEWNNKVASIAAFKMGLEREGGRTDEASLMRAAQFARDITHRGTSTGGKAQRSVGLWGIKTRAVPQLMSTLQTYTLGWFSQMAADYKIGFLGAGKDITPQQRLGSKKAFVYGLAAQSVLAGAIGLPGVGQGIALLNQATGLDLKGWLRQNLAKLFDEDQDSGGLLTNLALRGAANALTPIDPSNRAALSVPFVGVDPYKGFSVAALAGAAGTSVSDLVQGLMATASGDLQGMQKLLPSVLKGPAQLAQGEWDVRDARGGLLQTLSPAERFAQSIGLPPSRIQRARDTAEALKKKELQAQRMRESLVDRLATMTRKGDIQGVQQEMLKIKQADPTIDLRALGRSVSARVVAQSIPYDARRTVNPAMDLAGLQTRRPSTEVARRELDYQTQSLLGLNPIRQPRADWQAAQMDALMDSNPYLPRSRALRTVRGTQGVANRYTPLWMQGNQ